MSNSELVFVEEAKALPPHSSFTTVVAIRKAEVQNSQNAGAMLRFEFFDRTGSFSTVMFSNHPQFERLRSHLPDGLCYVRAEAALYRGAFSPSLTGVDQIVGANGDQYLDRVQRCSAFPYDELVSRFDRLVKTLSEPVEKAVRTILTEVGAEFYTSPAGRDVHHNYRHGLLEHTVSMGEVALMLMPHYRQLDFKREVVLASIILHDAGKVSEYSQGVTTTLSASGLLNGHISVAYALWHKAALQHEVAPGIAQNVGHCILSHHGQKEFGSPAEPHTIEAWLVHQIDLLDSRMGIIDGVLSENDGPITPKKYFVGELIRNP